MVDGHRPSTPLWANREAKKTLRRCKRHRPAQLSEAAPQGAWIRLSFKLSGAAAPSIYADTAKGRAVCPEQRAARWVAGWQAPLGIECGTKALLTVWGLGIG
uniref:Uncharacterized protein n=1 Tax=Oryza barthii TaxID=65489 RepID=A0A0D3EV26_9ORYZ